MSNVDRLNQAGVINSDVLSDDQRDYINHKLTDEEVHELIKLSHKLAPGAGVRLMTSPAPH